MKLNRITRSAALLIASVLQFGPAYAVDDGSCSTMLRETFATAAGGGPKYNSMDVAGTFVTARGTGGFHGFTMATTYEVERGIVNSYSASRDMFWLQRSGTAPVFTGKFNGVMPGRSDGSEDLTTLEIHSDGRAVLVLDRWGNVRVPLSGVSCYSGHSGVQFVLTGFERSPGYGVTVYTFVLKPFFFG